MTEPDRAATGQLNPSAAEVYETFFVPALFDQWPLRVLDAAGLRAGDDLLDVGCGTGVLARAAARRLLGSGSVTGVDLNDGMLTVARRSPEPVTWTLAPAEDLPFTDRSFDRVVSHFALMFFTDPVVALSDMARVTRRGGTIALTTWAGIDESPGYAAMVGLLRRLFGDPAASALEAPFTLGTAARLTNLVAGVLPGVTVARLEGQARFESLEAWLHTDIRGWTLADLIDDDQYAELLDAATSELAGFVGPDGQIAFPAPALLAIAER